ncbi:Nitric oxide dioxygenase [Gracilaria domingensis]|nr:Nitric oxide dioxygenase [Gracilaria domingensis]
MQNAVERICSKHVSRHVKSDHYPAVATAFSKAARQVLNDQLSEDDLKAWEAAVMALAGVLIKTEQKMYNLLQSNDRHWEGFRTFSVEGSEEQASAAGGIVSRQVYKMCPSDGGKLPKYLAGESICVRVNHDDYGLVHCGVSLCPRERKGELQISIPARSNSSKGASSESVMKEKLDEGDVVEVSSPIANLLKKQKSGKGNMSSQSRMARHDFVRVREANAMPGVITRGHTARGSNRQHRRLDEN